MPAGLGAHPTAGYILDLSQGARPGRLLADERRYLRHLAEQVLALAVSSEHADRRQQWYRHNALGRGRPMLLLFPENAWEEILPEQDMRVRDPFWRNQEWYLRHLLYRSAHFPDDFAIEPEISVRLAVQRTGWGMDCQVNRPEQYKGAYKVEAPLRDPADIAKLTLPTVTVDMAATCSLRDALGEVFSDLLPVRVEGTCPRANLIGTAANLRGLDQLMMDMYDRPDWVHRLMDLLATAMVQEADWMEADNHLTLNSRGHYNDSGGLGYTRQLPQPDFDGTHVRLKDLWGYGVAQELVLVGPAQHDEFVLQYQLRLLARYGLNAYGCCEPYTRKYEMLAKVPRLRRVSVSPWSDIEVAAQRLGDRCIFSWKPHPAMLVGAFDPDGIRAYIRRTLEVARDCILEIILKDTHTLEFHPERLDQWVRIAREEIERSA